MARALPANPPSPPAGPGPAGWAWLIAVACLAVLATAWHLAQRPAIGLTDCLRGQEVVLHLRWLQGQSTPAADFLTHDESAYVRMAEQLARGAVATDYLGDFLEQVRQAGDAPALFAASPMARLARDLAALWPSGRPSFVAYRSAVFAAWGAPVIAALGCNDRALTVLRATMLPWRAVGVVLAGLLAWTLGAGLARRWRLLALALASSVLALDALVNDEASHFMPDTPALALLLAALWLLARLLQRPQLRAGLALGVLCGVSALVKADLLYVLPLALAGAWLAVPVGQRRSQWQALWGPLGLALLVHALVLAAWAWRNHGHTGAWILTSKDAINLYLGNSAEAPSRGYHFGTSAADWAVLEALPAAQAEVVRRHGPEVGLQRGLRPLAAARLLEDPSRTARMALARAGLYLGSGEFRHYPALGAVGQALAWGVMLGGLAATLAAWGLPGRRGLSPAWAWRPLTLAWAGGLVLVSLVGFEMRYQLHLFALAGVGSALLLAALGERASRPAR